MRRSGLDSFVLKKTRVLSFSSDYGGNNFYNPFLSARRIFPGKTYIYFLPEVPNLICTAGFSHCFIYFINNMSFSFFPIQLYVWRISSVNRLQAVAQYLINRTIMSLSDMFFFDLLLCTFQDSCDIKIRNYSKNGGPPIYVKGENLRKGVATHWRWQV